MLVMLVMLLVEPSVLKAQLFFRGDVNADANLDISDAVAVFGYLFVGREAPACLDTVDANDDGMLNLTDGIAILEFLFRGGDPLPPPRPRDPCPGPDPTDDTIPCENGVEPSTLPPGLALIPVESQAPGVRQRSRVPLEAIEPGKYRVLAGTSFAILVDATSNRISQASFSFQDPDNPHAGNPSTLEVRCDRDLGDPTAGGIAAGENLAPLFFGDVDIWVDQIYLITHAALRISGTGALSPTPGEYRFNAVVTDEACARSEEASFSLTVEPSAQPEIFAWVETNAGDDVVSLLQHDPGSGNVRLTEAAADDQSDTRLVIEALPNGQGGPAPETLDVRAVPPFPGGEDLGSLFVMEAADPAIRFSMPLSAPWFPTLGNTDLTITIGSTDGSVVRTVRVRLEVEVHHESDIEPIWRERCTGCHEEPDPEKGLVLVDPVPGRAFRNVVNVFASEPKISSVASLLVRPFFPDRSYLYHKIQGTHLEPEVGGDGGRMPDDESILKVESQRLIESWILQGALE